MGYGATDSHDIPRYAGTEQQVRSAAKGLRAYLTPGHKFYVGGNVGKPYRCSDGYYTPQTLAEAAQLQYTPWVKYLPDTVAVWESLFGKEQDDMITKIEEAEPLFQQARLRGETRTTLNGKAFVDYRGRSLLTAKGMCSAAQRRATEICGQDSGPFSCCATSTGQHLAGAGKRIAAIAPGALLVFRLSSPICRKCKQGVGHIVAAIKRLPDGDWLCGENTSSDSRGVPLAPGFKLSRLSEIDPHGTRLTGIYSLQQQLSQASYVPGGIVVKINDVAYLGYFDGTDAWLCIRKPDGMPHKLKVRSTAEAAGCVPPAGVVKAHFAEDPRTVYVYGPWKVPAGAVPWVRG